MVCTDIKLLLLLHCRRYTRDNDDMYIIITRDSSYTLQQGEQCINDRLMHTFI